MASLVIQKCEQFVFRTNQPLTISPQGLKGTDLKPRRRDSDANKCLPVEATENDGSGMFGMKIVFHMHGGLIVSHDEVEELIQIVNS